MPQWADAAAILQRAAIILAGVAVRADELAEMIDHPALIRVT